MKTLQELKDQMAEAIHPGAKENRASGLCINCKRPALDHCYSAAGRREFVISGYCEECFDEITGGTEV
jgi:hypothetical protein